MGPLPGWNGVSIASGHDHVGVMLSPGSAELVARYILDGDPRPLRPSVSPGSVHRQVNDCSQTKLARVWRKK